MENQIRLRFTSSIEDICDINESFASARLKAFYLGGNRNGSFISKASTEDAIPTMFNCPIVCNYDVESDTIGGHDMDIVSTDSGNVRLINLTSAIGVIPAGAKYNFEKIEEKDGSVHEYFVVDAILWKRSPAYDKIKRDGIVSQSMEITVTDGHMQGDLYMIEKFIFTAFCLLGEGVEPCFESASLQLFDRGNCRQQFALMMKELKQNIETVNPSIKDDNNIKNFATEGGEKELDKKKKLAAEYGLDIDNLGFSVDDMSLDDLRAKFEEMKAASDNGSDEDSKQDFSLESTFRDELLNALYEEKVETPWGMDSHYWFWDYDKELSEVYATDTCDWNLYGFAFSMDGDRVVIDFSGKKRMKLAVEPFDEGSADSPYREMFNAVLEKSVTAKTSELQSQFNTEKAALEKKYQEASGTIEQMNTELNELRQYKQQKLNDERNDAEGAVFAMFPDLNGIEAFEKLKENCAEMSIEDIEDKCFAIRGRHASQQTFSMPKSKTPRLPIEKSTADEPYGGLFVEFPPQR